MNNDLQNKLFAVIRSGMGIDNHTVDISLDECGTLLSFAKRQSILPIVYQGLTNLQIPNECIKRFDDLRVKSIYQVVQQQDALKRVSDALESVAIPYIPLKGAVLRNYYPHAYLRTSCDIDVLVHAENLDRAVNVIEQDAGFKAIKQNYHDISMIDSRVHLELHYNIKENMENIDYLLMKAWEYASPAENGTRYVFSPEFQLFHVIAHMSYHMVHGGLGIRPFLDLWLLRNKTEYDETKLRDMCSSCSILTFYEKSCALIDAWLSGKSVDLSLKNYEAFCLNGGVFGSSETVMASKQRTTRGIKYVWRRVFMSRSNLETEFPELKEKPYLLLTRQVKRWSRLLDKKKRNQVRKELEDLRALNPDAVESFHELLSSLGL